MKMVAGLSKAFPLAVPRPETEAIRVDLAYFQSVRAAIRKGLVDDGLPSASSGRMWAFSPKNSSAVDRHVAKEHLALETL